MNKRFEKNRKLLEIVGECKKKLRNSIILNSDNDFILTIIECVLNIMNGNVNLNDENFKILKPYNKTFKKLIKKKISLNNKRKIIVQKGGFLQFLIPAIISAVGSIASTIITKQLLTVRQDWIMVVKR